MKPDETRGIAWAHDFEVTNDLSIRLQNWGSQYWEQKFRWPEDRRTPAKCRVSIIIERLKE